MSPKTALITGCSTGGIGYSLVLEFQKRGLTVIATARNVSKMKGLESLANVHLVQLDVVDPQSIANSVEEVTNITGGKLDYLVNNSGVVHKAPVLDTTIEDAKALFDVNVWGVLRMIQAYDSMIIPAKGTIVNVGSIAGSLNLPFQAMYNSSKAASNLLSEGLRLELKPFGVKVITVMLGNVKTNMSDASTLPLPKDSRYLAVEDTLKAAYDKFTFVPVEVFAKQLVDKVLGGATGKVWGGQNASLIRWLVPFLPTWQVDNMLLDATIGRDWAVGLKKA
ncbi:putative hydroxybutyrate dehydrogenase [Amniculicola lignicola CBS 123094]|uniref:Putative hydroxybutyrate dehydrogenase n=1 Tax=Amniculicola lignicola CBS 123094 TaxID=1392246 RepID=A0A6A5WEM2_9PLEO|nr:putative hydroxybutyrate dehydrogenase [Amniculicola lignicola CBS 123094]